MQNKKDLKERAKRFALLVIKMYSGLPKTTVAQVLGKQVLRSSKTRRKIIHNSAFIILNLCMAIRQLLVEDEKPKKRIGF
jgi:hypothetical protein